MKFVFYARPHPGLLPRGEGIAVARFWFCGWVSGKSSRWFVQQRRRTFLLLLGEKAGMREVVKSNRCGLAAQELGEGGEKFFRNLFVYFAWFASICLGAHGKSAEMRK
jgi:hypothetical protein